MIDKVKALLKERNFSVAVIVDDAYDETPYAEDLAAAQWNSFFDDLSGVEEQKLRSVFGSQYDEFNTTELIRNNGFIAKLWNVRAEILPAASIFASYEIDQAGKRAALDPLQNLLRDDLEMTCHTVGRDVPLSPLGAQVIFLDLFLGSADREEAVQNAASTIRELIKSTPTQPPSVILMSRSPQLLEIAPRLRDDAEILGCQFRVMSKSQLNDVATVAENIYELVVSHPDAVVLSQFMVAWSVALDRSKQAFMRSIRSLDLADYANVQALVLESEGEPLGDYALDLYDLHLHSLLEGEADLVAAAQRITTINWKNYPPAQFTPSPALTAITDGCFFHNQVRTDSYLVADRNRMPRLGEIFLAPIRKEDSADPTTEVGKRYAYVVLSQACDLQHGETDRLLLLRGEAKTHSWKEHKPASSTRTPVMRVDNDTFSIDWDTVCPETWMMKELPKILDGGVRRVRTLRMPFALQLQQAFIGNLSRVGTLAVLPTRYGAAVRIFMRSSSERAILLTEASVDSERAVCLVGRTAKNNLMEWLLLSPAIKQQLREALNDVKEAEIPKGTPNLSTIRSDPEFFRMLGRGLLVKRDKSSRPFKDVSEYDVIQIITSPRLENGGPMDQLYGPLVIEIDFGESALTSVRGGGELD